MIVLFIFAFLKNVFCLCECAFVCPCTLDKFKVRFYLSLQNFVNLKRAMTADFVILSLLQKGEKSKGLKAHLLFLDTSLTLSMTRIFVILSGVRKHKAKNPHFKGAIYTLNLWILRLTPQYDK